ncbi:MAG: alpha/beta fold hydrolase, partial [Steroidobacteraceae bacterium]
MAGDWFVRFRPTTAATVRLFCFPYAGGGAAIYRPWAQNLPASVDLCALQLPGRETRIRETPIARIDTIADTAVNCMQERLDLPFALFGHSMGSVIAFEVARRILAAGLPAPVHLWLSARRAPGLADVDPPLRQLGDDEFVDALDRRYGGIPAEVRADRELMALLLPGLRADIAALETHVVSAEPQLTCPLTVFGGSADPRAPVGQLDGWRAATAGRFRVRIFEGGHFYIVPRRAELLAEIATELAAAAQSARPAERR